MNYIVPIISYLSPLLLGLVVPFLIAFRNDKVSLLRIVLYKVTLPVIIVMIIVSILNIIYLNNPFSLTIINSLQLTVFLWLWALMTAGVCYLFITLGVDKNLIYIIISILILLTNTTIFYINPFINACQQNTILRQGVIKIAMNINPILVIAGNFFKHDILRSNSMYSICDIGPYYFYGYANWINVLLYYILISILTFGLAVISRKYKNNRI